MSVIAQTPRLIIREFLPDEEGLFVKLHQDEQVLKYIPRRNEAENQRIFQESLTAYADGSGLSRWGIFYKTDGGFIGCGLLRPAKEEPGKIELGYSMHVKYWGMGIATEMAKALIEYAFTQTAFDAIIAVTIPENIASQKVLLNAGMQQNGTVFWRGTTLTYFILQKQTV